MKIVKKVRIFFQYMMHSGNCRGCGDVELKRNKNESGEEFSQRYNSFAHERTEELKKKLYRPVSFEIRITQHEKNKVSTNQESEDVTWAETYNEEDFPRGWKNRKKYIAKDGTFFERGKLVPENYRTEQPTTNK